MDDILLRSAYYSQQYLPQSFLHYNQHHDQYIAAAAAAAYNQQLFNNNHNQDEDLNEAKRRKSEQILMHLNTTPGILVIFNIHFYIGYSFRSYYPEKYFNLKLKVWINCVFTHRERERDIGQIIRFSLV